MKPMHIAMAIAPTNPAATSSQPVSMPIIISAAMIINET